MSFNKCFYRIISLIQLCGSSLKTNHFKLNKELTVIIEKFSQKVIIDILIHYFYLFISMKKILNGGICGAILSYLKNDNG